ncbi:NAD(P)-dependent oxidoreductase [Streptomyces sp. NPDC050803]|uniref:NAD(P)-dependent oxidoreductase n=1 Tax=unclassified Streptomyces TaxID=2593676 RepID=UPI00341CDA69
MASTASAWQNVPLPERLEWGERHMKKTAEAARRLPSMVGTRLATCVHIDVKTAVYLHAFRAAGAEVAVMPADVRTTRADVAEYMAHEMDIFGVAADAHAHAGADCVAWGPTHTLEMGGDITAAAVASDYRGIIAGIEVTRTGINRLGGVDLTHPVFDLDRVPLKNNIHNRYAVGLSTWHAFMSRTNLSLHGRVVVVVGFGEVGSGLASAARSLGARVIIVEQDPIRCVIATYEGYETAPLPSAAARADVLVTATGHSGVVSARIMEMLPDGAFLLNAGHSATEVDLESLGTGTAVLPHVTSHRPYGNEILLVAGGHIVNLVAGDGDTLNSFDITAALMVSSVGWMVLQDTNHAPGIHTLPSEAWQASVLEA